MKRFFLFTLLFISVCAKGFAQSWVALDQGVKTVNGYTQVNALGFDNFHGYLYVGGNFDSAGDYQSRKLAVWNGSDWINMEDSIGGSYVNDIVAMTNWGDTVIFGFDNHAVVSAYGTELGVTGAFDHTGGDINCLFVFHDTVYVGGDFTGGIKKWNGQNWKIVGGGVSGISAGVMAINEYNDELVIGGYFQYAGDSLVYGIARFDGSAWHPMGKGMIDTNDLFTGRVFSLGLFNDNLVAGGLFDSAGNVSASNIAMWDGNSWSNPFGDGLDGWSYSMYTDSSGLYLGGAFNYANGIDMNYITRWDGNSFHPLANGFNDPVYDVARFQGNLYAGGHFTKTQDGDTLNYIAMYDISTNSWVAPNLSSFTISPNPVTTSIQLHLPSDHSTTLTLFNLLGEKVKEQTITGSYITIDVSELPAGMYVVRAGEWSGKPTFVNTTVGKFVKE